MAFVLRLLLSSNILLAVAANGVGSCTLAQQEHPATRSAELEVSTDIGKGEQQGIDDADYVNYLQSRLGVAQMTKVPGEQEVRRHKGATLTEAPEGKQLIQSEVSSLLQEGADVASNMPRMSDVKNYTRPSEHAKKDIQAEETRFFSMSRLHPMVVPLLDKARIWMLFPVSTTMMVACLLSIGVILHVCGAPTSTEKASRPVEFALEERKEKRKTETTGSENEVAEETTAGMDERILAQWRRDAAFQPMLDEEVEAVSQGSSDTDEDLPEADTESEPEGEEVELQAQVSKKTLGAAPFASHC